MRRYAAASIEPEALETLARAADGDARRALNLLHVAPFEHISVDDDLIEDIIVRKGVLNKIPAEKLVALVLKRVKPFMMIEEVTHLDLEPELFVDDQI